MRFAPSTGRGVYGRDAPVGFLPAKGVVGRDAAPGVRGIHRAFFAAGNPPAGRSMRLPGRPGLEAFFRD